MVRHYVPVGAQRQPRAYNNDDLQRAISLIQNGMPLQAAARQMNIPRRTLRNHVSGERRSTVVGRKTALLPEEEHSLAQYVAALGDSGYAFDVYELRLFVKSFLDKAGRTVAQFKDNMPGIEWGRSFLKRHSKVISPRKLLKEDVKPAHDLISQMVLDHLHELRETAKLPSGTGRGRSKRISVEPGKNVGLVDFEAGPSTSGTPRSPCGRKRKATTQDPWGLSEDDVDNPSPESTDACDSDEEAEALCIDMEVPVVTIMDGESRDEEDRSGERQESEKATSVGEDEGEETKVSVVNAEEYVMVKFFGKKQCYHYVGKVKSVGVNSAGETENVTIQYFRRVPEASTGFYVFKEPQNPDFYDTPLQQVVKKLPLPTFVKGKLYFEKSLFGKELVH